MCSIKVMIWLELKNEPTEGTRESEGQDTVFVILLSWPQPKDIYGFSSKVAVSVYVLYSVKSIKGKLLATDMKTIALD